MIDLETLSVKPNAGILVIAGVKFNPRDSIDHREADIFYRRINIASSVELKLDISEDTVKWWNQQEKEVYNEAFTNTPRTDLKQSLIEFTQWFGTPKKIWSHGASFDIPILENAYSVCGLVHPWKFWYIRDTRTIFDFACVNYNAIPEEKAHHALHDCYRQILGVKQAYKKFKC
jgi:hypothetical protein